jgi:hypothetical protein
MLLAAAAASLPFFISGCRATKMDLGLRDRENDQLAFVVSVHEFTTSSDPSAALAREIPSADGLENVWIRRIPLISSRVFPTAEVVAGKNGETALLAELDGHGRYLWMQLCAEYGGRPVAVVVDGVYRFTWRVPPPSSHTQPSILISGPWNPREAELIAEWAPKNYAQWHQKRRK